MKHHYAIVLALYFIFLLLLAPFNLLGFDSFYYWEWSRHLALSYYDGSPMIAYFIKLSTTIFGNTLFALSLVSVICTMVTSIILYKTARLFQSKESGLIAVALWLFSPLVTLDLLKQTTYDNPQTLFWALSLYYAIKFTQTYQNKMLYCLGASLGLLMLSKYSGVVLVLGLMIFLLTSPDRRLFKSYPIYLAALLSLLIFSPVIIWNADHEWVSFSYQLTTHAIKKTSHSFSNALYSFCCLMIPALNVMLIPTLSYWIKNAHRLKLLSTSCLKKITEKEDDRRKNNAARLCMVVCSTFFFFYLFLSTKANLREYWLTPYLLSSALLGGFYVPTLYPRRLILSVITIYGLISVGILLNNTSLFSLTTPKKWAYYHLMKQFNTAYPNPPSPVITSGWLEARMLFFLKNKPRVYTIPCGPDQNQYALWSKDIVQKLKNKTIDEVLYIDIYDHEGCLKRYFNRCVRLPFPAHTDPKESPIMYVYQCFTRP